MGHYRWFCNQFSPFFPVLHCPLGPAELQACPFPDVVFPPLPLSVLSFSPFHYALQDGFGQTRWTGDMTIPLQFASPYDGQEVFVWSSFLLDLGTDFLVGNLVFVWDVLYLASPDVILCGWLGSKHQLTNWLLYLAVAPHFHGLYSSLELCCEGPRFTSIQEDGCDNGARQSYLGAERNTPVIPNWLQPCQCCCCLCSLGEYLRFGTLISYKWLVHPGLSHLSWLASAYHYSFHSWTYSCPIVMCCGHYTIPGQRYYFHLLSSVVVVVVFVWCRHTVPVDSPSRGRYVTVHVVDINHSSLPTTFYSVLVSVSVFMSLSTVFYSVNSPDNSPLSHSVLLVLFLPNWSFKLYSSLWKSPSALI